MTTAVASPDHRLTLACGGTKGATSATPIQVDAHDWIRGLRLEYWRVAQLRELRVGEQFWIAFFSGPGVTKSCKGHCEAYIERIRGGYRFAAVWTMNWTANARHAHVMTDGYFNLLKGNVVEFQSERDVEAVRSFRLVCRYVAHILRHAKRYGLGALYHGAPYHCHSLWHGEVLLKDGATRFGVEGPVPRGLGAIVDVAIAIGAVPSLSDDTDE